MNPSLFKKFSMRATHFVPTTLSDGVETGQWRYVAVVSTMWEPNAFSSVLERIDWTNQYIRERVQEQLDQLQVKAEVLVMNKDMQMVHLWQVEVIPNSDTDFALIKIAGLRLETVRYG